MKSLTPIAVVSAVVMSLLFAAAVGLGVVAWRAAQRTGPVGAGNRVVVVARELFRDDATLAYEAEIVVPAYSQVRLTETPGTPGSGSMTAANPAAPGDDTAVVRLFVLGTVTNHSEPDRCDKGTVVSLRSESGSTSSSSRGGEAKRIKVGEFLATPLVSADYPFEKPEPAVEIDGKMRYLVVTPPGF